MVISDENGLALDATKVRPDDPKAPGLVCDAVSGIPGQRWRIASSDKGTYTIRNVSGRVNYLSMNDKAEDGWRPWFKTSVEGRGQMWQLREAG